MAFKIKIKIGQVVATPGAIEALSAAGTGAAQFLNRHQTGDWGEVCAEDWAANDKSAAKGYAMSVYSLSTGVKIWIITDPEAAAPGVNSTCVLLPQDY